MTAATVDASAMRSAGLYCLIPAVSRAWCLQAAVQATSPQFMRSGSAPSALLLPLCRRQWHAGGDHMGCGAAAVIHLHAVSGTFTAHSTVPMSSA